MTLEQDIAAAFDLGGRIVDVRPYGHGLINDTFVVSIGTGHRAILQRINRHVFPKPEQIMDNLRTLMDHIRRRQTSDKAATRELQWPRIFSTRDGQDSVVDAHGGFWRAMGFVENTHTLETITDVTQAEEVGFALGRFHTLIHDLDPARLHETLPGFHNAPTYLARFAEVSVRRQETPDNAELRHCLAFVETRRDLADVLEIPRREGKLLLRPIHGDTKLNNFLFDVESGRAVSLIDLDTVQPGLIHFDIGDCLRSCANSAGESPEDLAAVRFDLDICHAVIKHYFSEAHAFLTPHDNHYIYDAIRLIPFELGLRFLTDHLEGNHYFKTDWTGQNLHRALVQFALTTSIERNEARIKSLIKALEA
jgi:Ser/Thr protein kinase RdoA (MazF antagonist)